MDTAPRLCSRCQMRPARYQVGGICIRCSKGLPPAPLDGFDPATALPPVQCVNPLRVLKDRKAAERAAATATKAAERLKKRAAAEESALETIPPFVPFVGRAPAGLPAWAPAYLVALSELGREYVAANKAGATVAEVRALLRERKDFKTESDAAHGFYSDMLEIKLALHPQVAGQIVVAKRRRPKRFLEPALIQQTIVNNPTAMLVSDKDATALLSRMLPQVSEATRLAITGDVAEVVEAVEAVPA